MVIVPGIGGSGPHHQQWLWQRRLPEAVGFAPASWDESDAADRTRALRTAVAGCPAPPVPLARSLGCLAAAEVARKDPGSVAGASLVAPPDPDGTDFPAHAASFRPLGRRAIGVRTVLVSSRDSPYGSPALCAARGAEPVGGAVGHIDVDSRVGAWEPERAVFERFVAGLG